MVKRIISMLLFMFLTISNTTIIQAVSNDNDIETSPIEFNVFTYERNWQGNEIIVFMSVPEEAPSITLSKDMYAKSGHQWSEEEIANIDAEVFEGWIELGVEEPEGFEGERTLGPGVVDKLLEDEDSLTIAAGETKIIARIQAGNPMSWRNFYQTVFPTYLILNLNVSYTDNSETVNTRIVSNLIETKAYAEAIKIYDPESGQLWNMYDDDLVFFAGDKFHLDFTGFPTGWQERVGPLFDSSLTGYPNARMYFMVSYDGGPPETEAKILEEAKQDDDGRWYIDFENVNGTMSVVGTVAADLPEISLGYEIHLFPTEALKVEFANDPAFKEIIQVGPRPIIYEEGAIPNSWDFRLVFFGIEIPEFERVTVFSELSELGNLYETEQSFSLANPTTATVTFEKGLNIMGVYSGGEETRTFTQLKELEDNILASVNSEKHTLSIKVDTSKLTIFANHTATIQFLKAAERLGLPKGVLTSSNVLDYITISVFENDQKISDITNHLDIIKIQYDATNDVLSIPVKHFTEYVVGLTALGEDAIAGDDDETEEVTTPIEDDEEETTPDEEEALLPDTSDNSLKTTGWVVLLLGVLFVMSSIRKRKLSKLD